MDERQVEALLAQLRCVRDKALVLLMLQGGLRPGETLGLRLEDLAYGRRRVVVRHREDHPKGARSKSRYERVVDLHEPEALAAVSAYVMGERPDDAETRWCSSSVGEVGADWSRWATTAWCGCLPGPRSGWDPRALGDPARLATHPCHPMWEGGMRELTLQKRLGHASPESTRIYTRVSDPAVVADYNRALGGQGSRRRAVVRAGPVSAAALAASSATGDARVAAALPRVEYIA